MTIIDHSELFKRIQKLPALSAIVTELLSSIDQEDIDLDYIAQKISYDQVLTIKTLRLANSSFYGMQHKVSSLQEAIVILGFRNIRMLIATSAIIDSFNASTNSNFNFPAFWRHSIGTAVCAKEIAAHIGGNQEFAFITGLIHDIGQLALATQYAGEYEQAQQYQIEHNCDLIMAEQAIMGTDHSEVGKAVAQHWKFPEAMQVAVARHHPQDNEVLNQLSAIIHLANIFSLALDLSELDAAVVPKISPVVWEQMKLDEPACQLIFANTVTKFEEIARILI